MTRSQGGSEVNAWAPTVEEGFENEPDIATTAEYEVAWVAIGEEPVAHFEIAAEVLRAGQPILFDASSSSAITPGATIVGYDWEFGSGGGSVSTDVAEVLYTFPEDGQFNISLRVFDSYGGVSEVATLEDVQVLPPTASRLWSSLDANSGGWELCGLDQDGRLYCSNWTLHDFEVREETLRFRSFSQFIGTMCGTTAAGEVYCWGRFVDKETPTLISGSTVFRSVDVGFNHACGIDINDRAWCWGYYRLLGSESNPGAWDKPVLVNTEARFSQLSVGERHTCGVALDGTVICWGRSVLGNTGTGGVVWPDFLVYHGPLPVAGDLRAGSVAAASSHTCALSVDGRTYCWGLNSVGQVGVPPTACTYPPRYECEPVPTPILQDPGFAGLWAGHAHTCGKTIDGRTMCWGYNEYGELGDGTLESSVDPEYVAGEYDFASLSLGTNVTCALTSLDEAYCWGRLLEYPTGRIYAQKVPLRIPDPPDTEVP